MQEDRRYTAEADENGGGGDEGDEKIKTLRKTVGGGDNVCCNIRKNEESIYYNRDRTLE